MGRVTRVLRNLDAVITSVILVLLIGMIILQIVLRGVFQVSLMGTGELSRYFLVCVVFLSLPLVSRSGGHIRMEEIQNAFPLFVRRTIRYLSWVFALIAFGTVSVSATIGAITNMGRVTSSLEMPFLLFYLPTMLGFALVSLEYIVMVLSVLITRDPTLLDKDYIELELETESKQDLSQLSEK